MVWLQRERGLRPATAAKRTESVRAFFRDAVLRKLTPKNPFEGVRLPRYQDDRRAYVPVEIVERLIDATPDLEWKLLLAMARYLGVRVPSEPFSMTWDCVNWAENWIRVPSPKTAGHGKAYRIVPIFPPVRPRLEAVFEPAREGESYIFARLRARASVRVANQEWWNAVNLRQQSLRLIARIGERPWPRLWHALRASAEPDLVARFPIGTTCEGIGNTVAVAARHYLRIGPEDKARAIGEPWGGEKMDPTSAAASNGQIRCGFANRVETRSKTDR